MVVLLVDVAVDVALVLPESAAVLVLVRDECVALLLVLVVLDDELVVLVDVFELVSSAVVGVVDASVVVDVDGFAEASASSSEAHATSASGRTAVAARVAARVVSVRAENMADTKTPGVGKSFNLLLRLVKL